METSFADKLTYKLASAEDKLNLLEDIYFLLNQDMPTLDIALDLQKGSSFEKVVGANMERAVEQSKPLHEVFEPLMSSTTLQALKAGINGGDTAKGFSDASKAMQLSEGLFGKLIRSYTFPILKILAVVLATGFLGDFVFSQLVQTSPVKTWDFFSQFMYSYTLSVQSNWELIIVFTFGIIGLVWLMCTQVVGLPRRFIDKLPFFKQYRLLSAGSTLSNLSTLLNADEPLLESVWFLKKSANKYTNFHLNKIEENINRSRGVLGNTLNTGMINERDVHRLSRSIPDNEVGDRLMLSAKNHNTLLERQILKLQRINYYLFLIFFVGSLACVFASVFLVALNIR